MKHLIAIILALVFFSQDIFSQQYDQYVNAAETHAAFVRVGVDSKPWLVVPYNPQKLHWTEKYDVRKAVFSGTLSSRFQGRKIEDAQTHERIVCAAEQYRAARRRADRYRSDAYLRRAFAEGTAGMLPTYKGMYVQAFMNVVNPVDTDVLGAISVKSLSTNQTRTFNVVTGRKGLEYVKGVWDSDPAMRRNYLELLQATNRYNNPDAQSISNLKRSFQGNKILTREMLKNISPGLYAVVMTTWKKSGQSLDQRVTEGVAFIRVWPMDFSVQPRHETIYTFIDSTVYDTQRVDLGVDLSFLSDITDGNVTLILGGERNEVDHEGNGPNIAIIQGSDNRVRQGDRSPRPRRNPPPPPPITRTKINQGIGFFGGGTITTHHPKLQAFPTPTAQYASSDTTNPGVSIGWEAGMTAFFERWAFGLSYGQTNLETEFQFRHMAHGPQFAIDYFDQQVQVKSYRVEALVRTWSHLWIVGSGGIDDRDVVEHYRQEVFERGQLVKEVDNGSMNNKAKKKGFGRWLHASLRPPVPQS